MFNLKHKGQIGIFVVIGTILVIGMIFLASMFFKEIPIFNDEKTSYEVKEFVESCLKLETNKAVNKIGNSGGWIYPKPMLYTSRDAPGQVNRLAKGLDFLEKNKMPYWFYYDGNFPDGKYELNIPEYDSDSPLSIKSQMERYLKENLEKVCFKGFRDFKDSFDVLYKPEDINIVVNLYEKEIAVEMELDMEVNDVITNTSDKLEKFVTKVDNKIYLPYNLAREITMAEANTSFLDIRFMNLMRPYQSHRGRDLLPPKRATTMDFDFEPWLVEDVEKVAKAVVSSEISRIQFLNTDYNSRKIPQSLKNNEFANSLNQMFLKDYISETSSLDEENPRLFRSFKSLKVNPTFEPFFPIFFKIKQAIGNAVLLPEPEMFMGLVPITVTQYKASYEITAPVVLEIRHSNNINDNFVFNLPIEINLKHNTPFKDNLMIELEDLNLPEPTKSLMCNPLMFVSGEYKFNLTDPINFGNRKIGGPKKGVDGALIEFTCKNLQTCYVGVTSVSGNESIPEEFRTTSSEVSFRLPIDCDPGTLRISKFNHKTLEIKNLNPNLENDVDMGNILLPSAKTLNVTFGMQKSSSGDSSSLRSIKDYQDGFLIFEHKESEEFIRVLELNDENQFDLSIDLLPGEYKVTGIMMHNKKVIIPEEEICYKTGIFGGKDCQKIPESILKTWVAGGLEIPSFNVSVDDLLKYDDLRVTFVQYDVPGNYGELEVMANQMANVKASSNLPIFYNKR